MEQSAFSLYPNTQTSTTLRASARLRSHSFRDPKSASKKHSVQGGEHQDFPNVTQTSLAGNVNRRPAKATFNGKALTNQTREELRIDSSV